MAIQAQFPSYGTQDWMDNGCGGFNNQFCFNQQQQQQKQQCYMEPSQNKSFHFDTTASAAAVTTTTNSGKSQSMAAYDEKQRQELDRLFRLQNERLRMLLQEQKRSQLALILKRVETKVVPLLRQKDEEIAKASKRNMELEEFLKRLEMENQIWQRVAQDNESMIMSLNNTIEQLRDKAPSCCFNNGGVTAEDAESCCEETEKDYRGFDHGGNGDVEMKKMMMCKVCNSRKSCVLFLPCRHLCSCKTCEAFLDSCPVCQTLKKASIEALMV